LEPVRPESDIIGYADGEPIYSDRQRDDIQLAVRNDREAQAECGRVYFIQAVHGGPVKIGYSVNTGGRLRRLQEGTVYELQVIHELVGTKDDEHAFHTRFAGDAVTNGEWFNPTPELAEICGCRLDLGEPVCWERLNGGRSRSEKTLARDEARRVYRESLKAQRRYWRERQARGLRGPAT
jgi:Meiotically up-regulated gene 113